MALVLCPECRAEVSDRASGCPHCGYPISASLPAPTRPAKPSKPQSFITRRFALGWTAAAAFVGMVTMGAGLEGEEGGVLFATMLTWASVLPIWWKTRRGANAAPGGFELEQRVEGRLKEAEERVSQQLAELDDHRRQVVELEERVDFAERLLTKQRSDQLGGS